MQQLSGLDASFVYSESAHAPTHVTSIMIYDQSTAPKGEVTFKGILEYLQERVHLAHAFRRKLVRVPLDLDHPYWIEDGEFDLEYHVRHIALPKPGDWRQFCIQAARLHARPLDLARPLWEMYIIEGLDGIEGFPKGCFGMVLKVHHAAIDGMAGVEMITAIHEQTPDARIHRLRPLEPWVPERVPSTAELLSRASVNNLTRPAHFARVMGRVVPGMSRARAAATSGARSRPTTAPRTRFNGPGHAASGHRRVHDVDHVGEGHQVRGGGSDDQRRRAHRLRRWAAHVPHGEGRASRGLVARDVPDLAAHCGAGEGRWQLRCRRWSCRSARRSAIRSSA